MTFGAAELAALGPILVLVTAAVGLLLLESFTAGRGPRRHLGWLAVGACGLAALVAVMQWRALEAPSRVLGEMVAHDRFALFADLVLLAATALTALIAPAYLAEHGADDGETYVLLLLAAAGMMLLAAAADLVMIFLGLELMSLAVYVLTGVMRRSIRSAEAAVKYYLMGAFSTAFLLYGIALVYGATGTTSLAAIAASGGLSAAAQPLAIVGLFLMLVAVAFKVSAVPFHMWAPDAYEGAPTPVTGFMAAGVKTAAFCGALRLLVGAFGGATAIAGALGGARIWTGVVSALAAASLLWGNLAALRQENVKRLLAYSSIGHAGTLLLGVVAAGMPGAELAGQAQAALLFYLLAYTFTTIGAFGVVAWLGRRGDERLLLDDWAGLAGRHPVAAGAMTLFLLSLGGIPPTGGFFGKFYLLRAVMGRPDLLWLVVLAVLMSVVSAFYYLKVVMAMYFREPVREHRPLPGAALPVALVLAAWLVLQLGLAPGAILRAAAASVLP